MMYDIFDANELLFKALNIDEVKSSIKGKLYKDSRPINSLNEDIVVNTITITTVFKPQLATSNINVYVPDIEGIKNSRRLKEISRVVRKVFEEHQFIGKSVYISDLGIIQEENKKEHYVNLRIQWRIYDQKTN
ncbi:hypothetical protein HXZ94_15600 [Empedobacter falsenii]|uniref:hypothetical protein n=1 Tax=Empedobacter falsenii TaxID=343874 RepID=UPI002576AE70|nr:hypothetical protein [Empedobacter falsenii]MDM1299920.1 hypothetical protein [Empedobacter falsenii]MDM1319713.1 hypothetical protein [Empedobacter falsenii]